MCGWIAAVVAVASCGGRADTSRDDASIPQAQSSDAHTGAATAARPRVLIIGTSLTAGLGLNPDDAYPAVLQRIADSAGASATIVGAGVSGETSAGALRRVDWLMSEPASIVIIETGANDGLRGLDPDSTAANLRLIIAGVRAKAPSAKIVLVQMEALPNLGAAYTRRFHDMYPRVAKQTGATLMPFLLAGVAGDPALNQADGVHPTERGAVRVAANVWKTLGPLLKSVK
jgi:acyl-CoA thioesterase-1